MSPVFGEGVAFFDALGREGSRRGKRGRTKRKKFFEGFRGVGSCRCDKLGLKNLNNFC